RATATSCRPRWAGGPTSWPRRTTPAVPRARTPVTTSTRRQASDGGVGLPLAAAPRRPHAARDPERRLGRGLAAARPGGRRARAHAVVVVRAVTAGHPPLHGLHLPGGDRRHRCGRPAVARGAGPRARAVLHLRRRGGRRRLLAVHDRGHRRGRGAGRAVHRRLPAPRAARERGAVRARAPVGGRRRDHVASQRPPTAVPPTLRETGEQGSAAYYRS